MGRPLLFLRLTFKIIAGVHLCQTTSFAYVNKAMHYHEYGILWYIVKTNTSLLVWKQNSREYSHLRREYLRRV